MAAYMITEILSVKDMALMNEYRQEAGTVAARFGGRFLARAEPCLRLEGEWARVAIVDFPICKLRRSFTSLTTTPPPRRTLRRYGRRFL
jgi:uncharacterized protein (DUF1330 family)